MFEGVMNIRAAHPKEYPEICDLLDKAFKSKLERTIVEVTTSKDTNFEKGDLRVVEADGKIVSMMMLIRKPLRIGTAVVKGAIVAPVATHPDYQRRGYCSAVMRNAVQYMKKQGFDISILHGIPWLYPRYGYSPVMVETKLVIKPKQTEKMAEVPCETRVFTEKDLEQITRIYHLNTATRTLAEIRTPAMWEWKPGGSEATIEVFTNTENQVIGYCAFGTDWESRPCCHEIGVLNDEACRAVFNRILEKAKMKGVEEFYCSIHPQHPFARFAFGCGSEVRIQAKKSGMARVLNLVQMLTKMKKEFERRLCRSEFYNVECSFKLSSGNESAVLIVNKGEVTVSTEKFKGDLQLNIPLKHLNPLITGCKGIRELAKNPEVEVKGGKRAIRLIEVLFPPGFPSGGFPPLVWE